MTPPAIRAVSLDAYGTLFEGGSDDLIRMLRELLARSGSNASVEAVLARREGLIAELTQRAFMNMRDRDAWILTTLFQEYGLSDDVEPHVDALHGTYYAVKPYADTVSALEQLKAHGVRLAVTSNADEDMMQEVLQRTGITDAFDAVVTSERARAYKPAPAMFEMVAKELAAHPSEVLHVGDSFTADILGAKRAGMQAAWLLRPGGLPAPKDPDQWPDHTIQSLAEIPALLRP